MLATAMTTPEQFLKLTPDNQRRLLAGEPICKATSQGKRLELFGAVPEGMRLGWTCSVPYCGNPEHFELAEDKNYGRRDYKSIRERLCGLADGEYFDLPDEPMDEKSRIKFKAGLGIYGPRFLLRSLPDKAGYRIIRTGNFYDDKRETLKINPVLVSPPSGYMRLNLLWEPVVSGDCLLAPTRVTAYKMRLRVMGIDWEIRDKTQIIDATCADECCYAKDHLYIRTRRYRVGKPNHQNTISGVFLGMCWGTSKTDIPVADMPRCAIRGCAFISQGESSLCLQHQQFFEADGYERGVIDVNDMFADDNGGDAALTVGQLWEDRYNWLNVRKEGAHGKSAAEKENDQWWYENVIAKGLDADGVVTPKIKGAYCLRF